MFKKGEGMVAKQDQAAIVGVGYTLLSSTING